MTQDKDPDLKNRPWSFAGTTDSVLETPIAATAPPPSTIALRRGLVDIPIKIRYSGADT